MPEPPLTHYTLIAGPSTAVSGTAPTSVTVNGVGLASGATASLSITGGQLILNVVQPPGPTLNAAVGATVDAPFVVTFTDDAVWRAAVTGITVGGTPLTAGYTIAAGQITFTPSASVPANLLQTSGTKSIAVQATGYAPATVSQSLANGAIASLALAGISSPYSTVTPIIFSVNGRDQYNNSCVTNSTTVVTMTSASGNVQFDANQNGTYDDNSKTFSGGVFSMNMRNLVGESTTITGTDDISHSVTSGSIVWNDATATTDYFQSRVTGQSWATANTWESSHTGSAPWITATSAPTSAANTITILSGHTVTLGSSVTVDQVVVASGGVLSVNSTAGTLNLADGTGDDLTVQSGGVLQVTGTASFGSTIIPTATANFKINGGGKVTIGDGTGTMNGTGYGSFASTSATQYVWDDASIFEWNTNGVQPTSNGVTWFTGVAANVIPIFRISAFSATTIGGASTTVVNGLFEANAAVNWTGSATKTFRNGIIGTGTITQTAATGNFIISGTTAQLGGTGAITLLAAGTLTVNSGTTATLTSNKTINTGTFTLSGTLMTSTNALTGTAAFSLGSTGTLGVGSPDGINSGTSLGNIRVSGTRTFTSGASYVFNGAAAQVTGNGFPTGATQANLSITNTAGTVTMSQNITAGVSSVAANASFSTGGFQIGINGNFTNNGTFTIPIGGTAVVTPTLTNSDTMQVNGTLRFNTGGAFSGNAPSYGSSSTLNYATASTHNRGSEWTPDATSQPGYPANVSITSGTLNLVNGATTSAFQVSGNLTGNILSLSTLSQPFTVLGNITLNQITNSAITGGDLKVGGNLSVFNYTHNGRTLEFNGSSPQTWTDGGGLLNFGDVKINNPAGVTLSSPIRVQTLDLTSGTVTTTSTNVLTVLNTSAGAITGGSTSSFINGPLNRTLPANLSIDAGVYAFPVGQPGNYLPATLTNLTTGGTGPVVQIYAVTTSANGSPDGTTVTSLDTAQYWGQTIVSGNYTNGNISLTRPTPVSPFTLIASGLLSSTFSSIGGTASGNSINNGVTGTIATSGFRAYTFGALATYQLTTAVSPAPGGIITAPATNPTTVNHGAPTTITAQANSGYTFTGWTLGPDNSAGTFGNANDLSTTVTLIGDATATANFAVVLPPDMPTVNNSPQGYTGNSINIAVTCASLGTATNITPASRTNAGTDAVVTASCPGNGSYAATTNASAGSFTVNPAPTTVTFGSAPGATYPGIDFAVSASATAGYDGTIAYSKVSGPCNFVSGATFTPTGAGDCLVEATAPATTNWATSSAQQTVTITSAATNNYRSRQNGNWNDFNTWEVDTGSGFVPATSGQTPTSADGTVEVGHFVTVTANVTVDEVSVINGHGLIVTGATLNNAGPLSLAGSLEINEGGAVTGTPITYTNGLLNYRGTSPRTTTNVEWPATDGPGSVDNLISNTLTLHAARTIATGLTASNGTFDITAGLTLANGIEITRGLGSFTGTPTFEGNVYVKYTESVSTGSEIPADTTKLQDLYAQSAGGNKTLTLTSNATVNTAFLLHDFTLDTDGNTLTLEATTSSTVNGSASKIIGNERRVFGANGFYEFHVGTANGRSSVNVSTNAGTTYPAELTIKANPGAMPGIAGANKLARYWSLSSPSSIDAELTFNYLAGDVTGIEANYEFMKKFSGVISVIPPTSRGVNYATLAGVTSFSDWTLAEPSALERTVTFESNGGTTVPSQPVAHGTVATEPSPAPTKSGYSFAGWYSDFALTSAYNFATPVTADITLYAKWTASAPTITGAATATAFTTTYGTASAEQTFSISGANLTADITATAPTGFEVSNGGGFGASTTFTQSGGIATGTLHLRMKATAPVAGTYNGQTVALTSAGATQVDITTAASGNTVNPFSVAVTASSHPVAYGDPVPTVTASYGAFTNGETPTPTGTTCSTTYTVTSAFGTTPTTSCSGATSTNYTFTYIDGTVTISKFDVNITASSPTVTYGDGVPSISPTFGTFRNGQDSTVLTTQPICVTDYTNTSAVGSFPATSCSGAAAANYSFTYTAGSVTINKAAQAALTAIATPSTVVYGSTSALSTSGGTTAGAVTFSRGATTGCSISGSTLSVDDATLTCEVTATMAGDTNYLDVTSSAITVTLQKAAQATVTISGVPSTATVGDTFTAAGAGGTVGNFSYAYTGTACSVDSGTGAGTVLHTTGGCSVTATRAGDNNRNPETSAAAVITTITGAAQATVTLSGVPSTATVGDPFTAVGGGGSGTGAFSYAVVGTACSVHPTSGAGLVLHVSGGCSVTATRAGDIDYAAATSAASVITTINKANQPTAVTISGVPSTATVGNAFTAVGAGGDYGAYSYSVVGTACSVDSGTGAGLVLHVAGGCSVTATRAGDADYNPRSSSASSITSISQANQPTAVTLSGVPSSAAVGDPFTAVAAGGDYGTYSYAVVGTACSVDSGTGAGLVLHVAGGCSVKATRTGDADYNPSSSAPLSITTINKGTQATVTLSGVPSTATVGDSFTAVGGGGSGSGAISYAVVGTACTVDSGTGAGSVIHVGGGCSVTATRATDADYNAATSAASVITSISKGTQATVTLGGVPATGTVGGTFTAVAGGGSGTGAYSYSVTGTACTVDSGTGAGALVAIGSCAVTATRATDADYNVASSAASSITVSDAAPTGLTYSTNPASYTRYLTITDNTPSNTGGTPTSYSITPALPTGLSFSVTTGVISGTPTTITSATNYTVTATNAAGSDDETVSIATTARNLTVSATGSLATGTYDSITVVAPAVLTLTGDIGVNSSITVQNGAALMMGGNVISGAGTFTLDAGSTLGVGHAAGITNNPAAAGNVQVTGTRSYAAVDTIIYNGSGSQAVGDGLPSPIPNLTIANTGPKGPEPAADNTVTGNVIAAPGQVVTGTLSVLDGVYVGHSDYNNVLIAAAGILTLTDSTTVSGNWTNNGGALTGNFAVTLDGTDQVISGNTTFFGLSKTVATAATLTFASGSTTTVTNSLSFSGAAGNLLTLAPSLAGVWNIVAPMGTTASYVRVSKSTATGPGAPITASRSVDGFNNTGWIIFVGPSAAGVSVGGRVLDANGNPARRVRVALTGTGGRRETMSSAFGYYRFDDVTVGEIYVLSGISKQFTFAPRVVSVVDELSDLDLVAEP